MEDNMIQIKARKPLALLLTLALVFSLLPALTMPVAAASGGEFDAELQLASEALDWTLVGQSGSATAHYKIEKLPVAVNGHITTQSGS
jgi:hypothetical protein